MVNIRIIALTLLTLAVRFPVAGQSVVSTHSGIVYFFAGDVSIGNEKLEQKFGRFPDIGEGGELRTGQGRAEVLLTPGVVLRVGENSSIRLLSNKLSDTRVELVTGSAILESNDTAKNTAVTLIHQQWQMRVPHQGVYRIDSSGPKVQVYKGEVEVSPAEEEEAEGEPQNEQEPVVAREGEVLPLAQVLVPETSAAPDPDSFKTWAMNRSQAVAADNATAAEIIDDPSQLDNDTGLAAGGFSYFPLTGIPSLGVVNPYGLSFWSPYQSTLSAMWIPNYMYGAYGPVYGTVHSGWPIGIRRYPSPSPIYIPGSIGVPGRPGVWRPGTPISAPRIYTPPRIGTPVPGAIHAVGHR